MNILDNIPLNTKRQFVMAKTHRGCEVYMPIDSDCKTILDNKRDELQEALYRQPYPVIEPVLA